MSKLYGKVWNERMSMATKRAHKEITAQLLYGSRSEPKVGGEITIKHTDDGFTLLVTVPGQLDQQFKLV